MRKLLVVIVLLLAACNGASSRAEKMLQRGRAERAERLLVRHLAEEPDDEEARLLLGRVLLRRHETERAKDEMDKLGLDWHKRIVKVYREELDRERTRGGDKLVAQYARGVVRYGGTDTATLCSEILTLARERREAGREAAHVMVVAGTVDSSCREETLRELRTWIREAPAKQDGVPESLAEAAVRIDRGSANDFALALRDLALQYEREGSRQRASMLLDQAIELDSSIAHELETVVLRSRLSGNRTR